MAGSSSRGIFLSYRREDAAPYARLLQFQLSERFPDARVFMDLDSIEPGLDFAEVIREAVDSCAVLVALIGRQWATLADEQGRRRLDDPDDYVRFEVQTALEARCAGDSGAGGWRQAAPAAAAARRASQARPAQCS